jgi:hypothetical protein
MSLIYIQLQGEIQLVPKSLHAIDGNYSSKRAGNAGHVDQRQFNSDYLISREYVNRFADEVKRKAKKPSEDSDHDQVCVVLLTVC